MAMTPRVKTNLPTRILNVNRTPAQPKKRKKITLVFDEDKRREFLGGFRKRKLERRRKAQEDLQRQLKEEKKRIKQEAKERLKKLLSSRDVPELENLLSEKQYETDGHTVSILELNVSDLNEGSKWIGTNKGAVENEEIHETESERSDNEEIVGMSTNEEKIKIKSDSKEITSKKDLKREIKNAALKQVKKSKAFQQKQRLERDKNKKDSRKKLRAKLSQKQTKKKGNKNEGKFRRKKKH